MKKFITILGLAVLAFSAQAQTKTRKNNISAGFGFQQYNGDLGNTFFAMDEEWYGVGRIAYNRYISASFDAQIFATLGDFGHCFDGVQDPNKPAVLNMRSRLKMAGIGLKYKFANGYIMKENAHLAPYVYAGVGLNSLHDIWNGGRVNDGNYITLNGGLGCSYSITKNMQLTYNMGFGYFTSDALDYISKGSNDMYMQNTISLGYSFY